MSNENIVLIFKLSTGQDVISVATIQDRNYLLTKPLQLVTEFNNKTFESTFHFQPFMINCEDNVAILMANHVVSYGQPTEEILKHYEEATGVRRIPEIVTPSKEIILS
jgi:hypothetical protein